ncbi:hypothetical protein FB567DRAFT_554664 [Paraphoma chrysanthemicola]|uniref:Secreted protein n=1 Tax=Paraphoma chrysanthemicola TaxID=798071 RepID=A0A8K0QUK4_9PLEO|nr:hypothetical protein FB567DRAFT_554664 [Paraphoma chrysanthemicola]
MGVSRVTGALVVAMAGELGTQVCPTKCTYDCPYAGPREGPKARYLVKLRYRFRCVPPQSLRPSILTVWRDLWTARSSRKSTVPRIESWLPHKTVWFIGSPCILGLTASCHHQSLFTVAKLEQSRCSRFPTYTPGSVHIEWGRLEHGARGYLCRMEHFVNIDTIALYTDYAGV